jgi:hypothetical protein
MALQEQINVAQDFMWKNARILERHLFAHLFAGGPREPVLAALAAYQNADGGFAHGLEPDVRTPISQPIDGEIALHIIALVDGWGDPMVQRLCDWLPSVTTEEGGVPFTQPSVNPYPHAPWWAAEGPQPAALNPTASIAGLLHQGKVQHPWLERATAFCWAKIDEIHEIEFHTLATVLIFLQSVPDQARAQAAWAKLAPQVGAPGVVELDPDAEGYVQGPLDWAPLPTSLARPLFDDATLQRHLAALTAQQQPDGGWPISWPPISPGVELEWRGWRTIQALRTLRAYGA